MRLPYSRIGGRPPVYRDFFFLVQRSRLEEAMTSEHKVHRPLVRELEFLPRNIVNRPDTLGLDVGVPTRLNS